MEHEKVFRNLGLTEKQAKVYFALLELGKGSAHALSQKSGLKRPTTYLILDELIEFGIVSLIPRSKKKLYRPLSPHLLLERRKNEIKTAEKALPEIEALMRDRGMNEKPTVMFFEGVEGVKEVYRYGLEELKGDDIKAFYATASEEVQKSFNYYHEFHEKRKKLNISIKGFAPDDPARLGRYREMEKTFPRDEIRVLPVNIYSTQIAIEIGKTWVKTTDFENLQGLIIENPAFAKTMREIFEIVWKSTDIKDK